MFYTKVPEDIGGINQGPVKISYILKLYNSKSNSKSLQLFLNFHISAAESSSVPQG